MVKYSYPKRNKGYGLLNLETVFSDQADHDGLFHATISMDRHRNLFRTALSGACVNLGIQCGVTETKDGFKLGFKSKQDYSDVMAQTEERLFGMLDARGDSALDRRAEAALNRMTAGRGKEPADDACRAADYEELSR